MAARNNSNLILTSHHCNVAFLRLHLPGFYSKIIIINGPSVNFVAVDQAVSSNVPENVGGKR